MSGGSKGRAQAAHRGCAPRCLAHASPLIWAPPARACRARRPAWRRVWRQGRRVAGRQPRDRPHRRLLLGLAVLGSCGGPGGCRGQQDAVPGQLAPVCDRADVAGGVCWTGRHHGAQGGGQRRPGPATGLACRCIARPRGLAPCMLGRVDGGIARACCTCWPPCCDRPSRSRRSRCDVLRCMARHRQGACGERLADALPACLCRRAFRLGTDARASAPFVSSPPQVIKDKATGVSAGYGFAKFTGLCQEWGRRGRLAGLARVQLVALGTVTALACEACRATRQLKFGSLAQRPLPPSPRRRRCRCRHCQRAGGAGQGEQDGAVWSGGARELGLPEGAEGGGGQPLPRVCRRSIFG